MDALDGKTVAVIGYGNQGRAQALNLRDSGVNVVVGNRDDTYADRARRDGFQATSIGEAVELADLALLLVPDEVMVGVCRRDVFPHLRPGGALAFASGYNVAFGHLSPPEGVDVLLLAPRMIGVGVRETYLRGEGFYSFVGVHQDATGNAWRVLLALAKAVGTLLKGAVEVTFKQEAVLDLFNEQAFGPAFGRVLLSSIFTLIDAGYPPEAVLVEMYVSGEMSYTYEKMAKVGLVKQTNFHSHTSQYGAMSRGVKFLKVGRELGRIQRDILENIESGAFAEEWDKVTTKLKFKAIKFFATRSRINRVERSARRALGLPEVDLDEVAPEPTDKERDELAKFRDELAEFEEYYEF
ncbi:MAG: ketol-acid reductoisomerase [Promethearchaeota archaeon]